MLDDSFAMPATGSPLAYRVAVRFTNICVLYIDVAMCIYGIHVYVDLIMRCLLVACCVTVTLCLWQSMARATSVDTVPSSLFNFHFYVIFHEPN